VNQKHRKAGHAVAVASVTSAIPAGTGFRLLDYAAVPAGYFEPPLAALNGCLSWQQR